MGDKAIALIVEFTCELPNGVYARPASHIETQCNTFTSHIERYNLRTECKGNTKGMLSLVGTDTLAGDSCQLLILGTGEQATHQYLSQRSRNEFSHYDAPLAEAKNNGLESLLTSFIHLNPQLFRVRTVCSGSIGSILSLLSSLGLNTLSNLLPAQGTETKQATLDNGLTLLMKDIEFRSLDDDDAIGMILEVYRSLTSDLSLRQHLLAGVSHRLSCIRTVIENTGHFCDKFARSSNSYLQECALDVRDACFQFLRQICGEQRFPAPGKLTRPTACTADELIPGQFLELDKTSLKGLLLKSSGTTSYTMILARSFNIPTLVGVDIESLMPWLQQTVHINGNAGAVVVTPDESTVCYYQQEARTQDTIREQQRIWLTQEAYTADGIRMEVAANTVHSVEAQAAFSNDAEAAGLFRTEMLCMDRICAPDENEPYNVFCQTLEPTRGHSVIICVMDIGGDKPADYLNIPAGTNPFLGYHAVRIYGGYTMLFTT